MIRGQRGRVCVVQLLAEFLVLVGVMDKHVDYVRDRVACRVTSGDHLSQSLCFDLSVWQVTAGVGIFGGQQIV